MLKQKSLTFVRLCNHKYAGNAYFSFSSRWRIQEEKLNTLKFTSIRLLLFFPPASWSHTVRALCVRRRWRQYNAPLNAVPGRGRWRAQSTTQGLLLAAAWASSPCAPILPGRGATSRAQDTPRDLGTDPDRWSLSAYRFLSSPACVPKQLVPPEILLWAILSFMRAGFPSCHRPWHATCFHRLDEDAMCTHKA